MCEDDALKNKMILLTALFGIGFIISLPVFMITKNAAFEVLTITLGVTLYHFAMRLAVGAVIHAIMKNKADHTRAWFREKRFERVLYRWMRVREWKKHIPSYSPETFDTRQRTVEEIVGATCQAEIVHEVIMLLSLLPIALIPLLGGAVAMIVTSVLSILIDAPFVVVQRYNRPRLVRVMERFPKIG